VVTNKLCEIPLNEASERPREAGTQKGEDRSGIAPIDFDFVEDMELHPELRREFGYLLVGAGFLASKLIARKGQNLEA